MFALVNYSREILKILEENLRAAFEIEAKSLKMLEDHLEKLPGILNLNYKREEEIQTPSKDF